MPHFMSGRQGNRKLWNFLPQVFSTYIMAILGPWPTSSSIVRLPITQWWQTYIQRWGESLLTINGNLELTILNGSASAPENEASMTVPIAQLEHEDLEGWYNYAGFNTIFLAWTTVSHCVEHITSLTGFLQSTVAQQYHIPFLVIHSCSSRMCHAGTSLIISWLLLCAQIHCFILIYHEIL